MYWIYDEESKFWLSGDEKNGYGVFDALADSKKPKGKRVWYGNVVIDGKAIKEIGPYPTKEDAMTRAESEYNYEWSKTHGINYLL
jgi:hypothetical protein